MKVSLRTWYDTATRKGDPVDPTTLAPAEIAGMLHGHPAVIETMERHLEAHPALWNGSPADMMRELARLAGVGKAAAAWYVLNEIQVGKRIAAALDDGAQT